MLMNVRKRVSDMDMEIKFEDDAIEKIASEGYDDFFGARPLRRAITRLVEDGLSRELLAGRIKKGDSVSVKLSESGDLIFCVNKSAGGI
jgi:ATP-dependent Clp protease ATP-binding subunit ClpC